MYNLFPWITRKRAETLARHEPLVIISRGHSGTRVLTWMCAHLGFQLGTSENKRSADTDKRFTNCIKKLAAHTRTLRYDDAIRPRDLRRFQSAVWNYHQRLGAPPSRWGWKFPETYLMVPLVARTFPHARFLHLVRDGRDIAFKSHLTDRTDNPVGRGILADCDALDLPHHLQAALSWEYQVRHYESIQSSLPAGRVLDLRFEDLCLNPFDTAEQVCRFLDVPMTENCRRYLASEVDAGKVAQYRNESPDQVREVEERIGSTLRYLGYALPV